MNRRAVIWGLGSILVALPTTAHADYFDSSIRPRARAWKKIPSIVVVSSKSDFRLPLLRQSADFWNNEFAKLLISFRLGPVTHVTETIPIGDIEAVRANPRRQDLPESIGRLDGDVIVALSDGDFNSFAFRSLAAQKALVAIRNYGSHMAARFAIAHELGHVIGLGHNDQPGTLMYNTMPSYSEVGSLQLTDTERITLLQMYPPRLAG
jgi:hypothetical protein